MVNINDMLNVKVEYCDQGERNNGNSHAYNRPNHVLKIYAQGVEFMSVPIP